jgi:HemX protein
MEVLLTALNAVLPALYGALAVIYGVALASDSPRARRAGPRLLVATFCLHLFYVICEGAVLGHHPIADKFELFSFAAMAMAGSYLWVEWRRKNVYTGVFPLGLAFLLQACASLGRPGHYEIPEVLRNPLFAWHSIAAALSVAALSVGAVYGGLFLIMYRLLKRGEFGSFTERMPSLDVLAAMSLHAVEVGFVALTVAVGLGDVWVSRTPDFTMADPKIWSTFAVWAIYGAALGGRHLFQWGGWRVVALNLAGYSLLLGSMLVVGRVFDSFHRFTGRP